MTQRNDIAKIAYDLWEKSGRIHGRDMDDWLEAERILKNRDGEIYQLPIDNSEDKKGGQMMVKKGTSRAACKSDVIETIDWKRGPLFRGRYDLCDQKTKRLFSALLERAKKYCTSHYPTDKPDYRLKKSVVFCVIELFPARKEIKVYLRADRARDLSSQTIHLERTTTYYPGVVWFTFKLTDKKQLTEAIGLIKEIYKHQG